MTNDLKQFSYILFFNVHDIPNVFVPLGFETEFTNAKASKKQCKRQNKSIGLVHILSGVLLHFLPTTMYATHCALPLMGVFG